jgi:hypothetical protein
MASLRRSLHENKGKRSAALSVNSVPSFNLLPQSQEVHSLVESQEEMSKSQKKHQCDNHHVLFDDVTLIDCSGLSHDPEVTLIDNTDPLVSNGECVVPMSKSFESGLAVNIVVPVSESGHAVNIVVPVSESGPTTFSINNVVLESESGTASLGVDNVVLSVDSVAVPSVLHGQLQSASCLYNDEMGIVQSGANVVAASPIASDGFIPAMPGFLAFDP